MLPIRAFIPNVEGIRWLYEKFLEHNDKWQLNIPDEPIAFTAFVSGVSSFSFTIGSSDTDPIGIILFTDIAPDDNCTGHIFVWGKEEDTSNEDLLAACRTACVAIMRASNLKRINAVTPVPAAAALARKIGFVEEAVLRKAITYKGERKNAWLLSLIEEDLPKVFADGVN